MVGSFLFLCLWNDFQIPDLVQPLDLKGQIEGLVYRIQVGEMKDLGKTHLAQGYHPAEKDPAEKWDGQAPHMFLLVVSI